MFIFNIEKTMFGYTADSFAAPHNPIRPPLQEVYVRLFVSPPNYSGNLYKILLNSTKLETSVI